MINNHSILENERLVYRIYGTKSMKLGNIMDVQQKLLNLYPANYQRIILEENEQVLMDDAQWTRKLEELKILKIDKPRQYACEVNFCVFQNKPNIWAQVIKLADIRELAVSVF